MTDQPKAPLPGNHGQFGVNNATESHKQLGDQPDAPVEQPAPENLPKPPPADA